VIEPIDSDWDDSLATSQSMSALSTHWNLTENKHYISSSSPLSSSSSSYIIMKINHHKPSPPLSSSS
jgi:hypothetical protein